MTAPAPFEPSNPDCMCVTLDRAALLQTLDAESGQPGFGAALANTHPFLFASSPVFMAPRTLAEMNKVVSAVEAVARLPAYQAEVLAWAPNSATRDFGPAGALMGYDFHSTEDGPILIEINTNAGGAFLNAILARAQRACCGGSLPGQAEPERIFADRAADMFVREWQRQGRGGVPRVIAIVDDEPQAQHLLPEFLLARASLESRGFEAIIADPGELTATAEGLWIGDRQIDLVYNRLVDFALEEPRHGALRAAYLSGNVVLTPNPWVHAVLADKRNLTLLSDRAALERLGAPSDVVEALQGAVPRTVAVTSENAQALWDSRRSLFFKPARGYGSRAAYSGAKLTRRVWSEILAGEYIAQTYASPGRRRVLRDGSPVELKVDVRLYTYEGSVMLVAARLYQGQTTNMRTPGGGFAPVLQGGG